MEAVSIIAPCRPPVRSCSLDNKDRGTQDACGLGVPATKRLCRSVSGQGCAVLCSISFESIATPHVSESASAVRDAIKNTTSHRVVAHHLPHKQWKPLAHQPLRPITPTVTAIATAIGQELEAREPRRPLWQGLTTPADSLAWRCAGGFPCARNRRPATPAHFMGRFSCTPAEPAGRRHAWRTCPE